MKNWVRMNWMCKCEQANVRKKWTQIENWPRIFDALLNMSCLHFAFSHKVHSVAEYALMQTKQRRNFLKPNFFCRDSCPCVYTIYILFRSLYLRFSNKKKQFCNCGSPSLSQEESHLHQRGVWMKNERVKNSGRKKNLEKSANATVTPAVVLLILLSHTIFSLFFGLTTCFFSCIVVVACASAILCVCVCRKSGSERRHWWTICVVCINLATVEIISTTTTRLSKHPTPLCLPPTTLCPVDALLLLSLSLSPTVYLSLNLCLCSSLCMPEKKNATSPFGSFATTATEHTNSKWYTKFFSLLCCCCLLFLFLITSRLI